MKKIGLALGGGAVLGAAHIGIVRALEEHEVDVEYIAGTSIGALVGAFYAFGKDWDEIEALATELKWMDISGVSLSRYGLLSNDKLGRLIRKYLGDRQIEEANIPFAIVTTDISTGDKVVLKKGPVAEAVKASMCIPGVFHPLELDGKMLVDGGVVENVPISTVSELGAEYIIGVELNAKHTYKKPKNILDVLLNSFHFLIKNSGKLHVQKADFTIEPDLSNFKRSDMGQIKALIRKGYTEGRERLKALE
ncbi:MAG: patatin-like phospholipase family protein [Bacteroidota bacterium]